jgi:hypothetical protein
MLIAWGRSRIEFLLVVHGACSGTGLHDYGIISGKALFNL